jgi:hypothetical protein
MSISKASHLDFQSTAVDTYTSSRKSESIENDELPGANDLESPDKSNSLAFALPSIMATTARHLHGLSF